MNRRNFLRNSSLAGLSLTTLSITSCNNSEEQKVSVKDSTATTDNFELNEITIDELQKRMQSGQTTSHAITQLYLDRIQKIDKNGPGLNSIIELNPDALSIADALDEERKNGKLRSPLHGIPVLIKDNIDTADKMQTTAGALAMEGNIAKQDSFVAKKLRDAGAVILGKTNLSEWANFRSSRSVSGWSSRGGQTRNPYVLDRSPCGSSSGSGVAVSANLCVVAIGTETDGSINCPASVNGVVGIKPTVGLVSRAGIIPISKTQDTAGPLARTVRDAVILLNAVVGVDANDQATLASSGKAKTDYTQYLDANALKGKRIGIEKTFLKHHEAIDALLQQALEQMKKMGATLVEVQFIQEYNKAGAAEFEVLKYEFKDGLNKYLSTANSKMKSLQDVINFNKQNESKAMPYFKQEILDSSQKLGALESKEYIDALNKSTGIRKFLDGLMQKNQLNALCGPAAGASWCVDLVNGDAFSGYGSYGPAAMAGYPSISVPMGSVNDLPVGLSFISTAWDEANLIAIAYSYEQASKKRFKPSFKPTYS